MNDDFDNTITDKEMLEKLLRDEIDRNGKRRTALADLDYYSFLDCLYTGWIADCEPESHIDLERVWKLMTGELE